MTNPADIKMINKYNARANPEAAAVINDWLRSFRALGRPSSVEKENLVVQSFEQTDPSSPPSPSR